MGVDHSNAFVRLTFDGLIAFCFTKRGECQMGMVQNDDHQPVLKFVRINPDGSKTFMRRFELDRDDNVRIEAEDPLEPGATTFPSDIHRTAFNRLSDDHDPEDLRWIMDLQGTDFHGSDLKLKDDPKHDPTSDRLRPTIVIPHGIFYAQDKTPDTYIRHPHMGMSTIQNLGKIADKVGADIVCDPIGGRVKVTVGKDTFTLAKHTKKGKGFRYRISITNLCRSEGPGPRCPADESDFPLYYKVAVDSKGIQFDVRDKYVQGDPRGTKTIEEFAAQHLGQQVIMPELANFRSNGPPQVCNVVFLSQTTTIP